jgi:hypothetical protein
VKIDVEGAELKVLQGSPNILAAGKATFLIELHDWADAVSSTTTVRQFMRDAGYLRASFFGMPIFTQSRTLWLRLKMRELRNLRQLVSRLKRRLGRYWRSA